jgi:hypothetical protein
MIDKRIARTFLAGQVGDSLQKRLAIATLLVVFL